MVVIGRVGPLGAFLSWTDSYTGSTPLRFSHFHTCGDSHPETTRLQLHRQSTPLAQHTPAAGRPLAQMTPFPLTFVSNPAYIHRFHHSSFCPQWKTTEHSIKICRFQLFQAPPEVCSPFYHPPPISCYMLLFTAALIHLAVLLPFSPSTLVTS